jgi:hypothetical protein
MKKIIFLQAILFVVMCGYGQRVGIGTDQPISKLSIDSGLNIDQANVNGFALESALTFGNNKKVGIGSRRTAGLNQAGLDFYTQGSRRMSIDSFGNVGIGTTAPDFRLHVSGSTYISGSGYISGGLGIGTVTPDYAFQNNVGYNHMPYSLGIGTVPTSTYKLDVDGGPVRMRQDVRVDGILNPNNALIIGSDATVQGGLNVVGDVVVQSNKGIVRSQNSTQLKVVRTSVELSANNLAAGGFVDSGAFFYESFGAVPQVYVGNMQTASNNDWHKLEFIPFNVTANSCQFRVMNHGSSTASVAVKYSILVIGAE